MERPVAPGGHTSSNPPESGGQRYVLISLGFALQALEPFSKRMNLSEQRTLSFRPLATKELIAEC
jgi:hypothetical protein